MRLVLLGVLAGTAVVDFAALSLGWWWVTLLVAVAVAARWRGSAVLGALLAGTLLAWASAMWWQSGSKTMDIANLLGAMVFNGRGLGWLILIITFGYAMLLALVGAWLGAAARRLMVARRTERAVEAEPVIPEVEKVEEQQHV